jgi:hypothetical protein
MSKPLSAKTIERALREASDEQIVSENARRNSLKRKIRTGGRNGGRPKKVDKK